MKLTFEKGRALYEPEPFRIREALEKIGSPGNCFLIIDKEDGSFMQVAFIDRKGYYIEIKKEESGSLYYAADDYISFENAAETLICFAENNNNWYTKHDWEKVKELTTNNEKEPDYAKIYLITALVLFVGIYIYTRYYSINAIGKTELFFIFTILFGLCLPAALQDFNNWKNINPLNKTRTVGIVILFIFFAFLSLLSLLTG